MSIRNKRKFIRNLFIYLLGTCLKNTCKYLKTYVNICKYFKKDIL